MCQGGIRDLKVIVFLRIRIPSNVSREPGTHTLIVRSWKKSGGFEPRFYVDPPYLSTATNVVYCRHRLSAVQSTRLEFTEWTRQGRSSFELDVEHVSRHELQAAGYLWKSTTT